MRFQCQILYWGLNIILFILSTAINTRHFYFQFTNEENKDKRFNNKLASKFHSQDWNLDLSNCELELCCLPPHPYSVAFLGIPYSPTLCPNSAWALNSGPKGPSSSEHSSAINSPDDFYVWRENEEMAHEHSPVSSQAESSSVLSCLGSSWIFREAGVLCLSRIQKSFWGHLIPDFHVMGHPRIGEPLFVGSAF